MKFSNKGHSHMTFGKKSGFFSKFLKTKEVEGGEPTTGGNNSNMQGEVCIDWEIECELTMDEFKTICEESRKNDENVVEDAKRIAEGLKIISKGLVDSAIIMVENSGKPVEEIHTIIHEGNLRETEFHKEERIADLKADKEVDDLKSKLDDEKSKKETKSK